MENDAPSRPFGRRDTLGYLLGGLGGEAMLSLASLLLMDHYVLALGVDAAPAAMVMTAGRMLGAFAGLTAGRAMDRARCAGGAGFGRYLRRLGPLTALAGLLLFAPWVRTLTQTGRLVWMAVTWCLWCGLLYPAAAVAYGAMLPAASDRPDERLRLSRSRAAGSVLAGMLAGLILPLTAYREGTGGQLLPDAAGAWATAIFFALLAQAAYLLCPAMTRGRVPVPAREKRLGLNWSIRHLVFSRPFLGLAAAWICQTLAQLLCTGLLPQLYSTVYHDPAAQVLSGVTVGLATLLGALFLRPLAARLGSRKLTAGAAGAGAVLFLAALFLRPAGPWAFWGLSALACVGLAFFSLTCWAMAADVSDALEKTTGVRADGEIYGALYLVRALTQAASTGLVSRLLAAGDIYTPACLGPGLCLALTALALGLLYPKRTKPVRQDPQPPSPPDIYL